MSHFVFEHRACLCLTPCTQNPDAAGSAQIRVELGQDGGTVITALLEKALHLRDTANKVAEEQKEKTRTVCGLAFQCRYILICIFF